MMCKFESRVIVGVVVLLFAFVDGAKIGGETFQHFRNSNITKSTRGACSTSTRCKLTLFAHIFSKSFRQIFQQTNSQNSSSFQLMCTMQQIAQEKKSPRR
eukprot:c21257_g1_i1.p2 GENE.c21257_g1_i1~~c21257_g1_i1.p2  ORF type:complete len:100 (+),score=16.08 c21257_g1_i1:103-402(+)